MRSYCEMKISLRKNLSMKRKCYQRCGETRLNSATSSYSNKNLRNVRYELRGENKKKLKKQKSGGMVIVLASLPGFFTYVCVLSHLSHVWLCATLWTVARQGPLSMGFSRQESWSGLPCPSPGGLPNLGIKRASLISYIGRQILYHKCHLGSPLGMIEEVFPYIFVTRKKNIFITSSSSP